VGHPVPHLLGAENETAERSRQSSLKVVILGAQAFRSPLSTLPEVSPVLPMMLCVQNVPWHGADCARTITMPDDGLPLANVQL
jgi:hypothetical protein